jgi:hypothetical protein
VSPDPDFVEGLVRRVESALTSTSIPSQTKEITVPALVSSDRRSRRWIVAAGVAAALLLVVGIAWSRSGSNNAVRTTTTPTPTSSPTAVYSEQLDAAYKPFYTALNRYFDACQFGINDPSLAVCASDVDESIAVVNTFTATVSALTPPAELASDQQQLLTTAAAILDVLQQSAVALQANDRTALRNINGTFGTAYEASCPALLHFNSLAPNLHHLRTDLGPTCH